MSIVNDILGPTWWTDQYFCPYRATSLQMLNGELFSGLYGLKPPPPSPPKFTLLFCL